MSLEQQVPLVLFGFNSTTGKLDEINKQFKELIRVISSMTIKTSLLQITLGKHFQFSKNKDGSLAEGKASRTTLW
jgi:hypothetical protein